MGIGITLLARHQVEWAILLLPQRTFVARDGDVITNDQAYPLMELAKVLFGVDEDQKWRVCENCEYCRVNCAASSDEAFQEQDGET